MDTTFLLRRTPFDDPLAQRLVAEVQQELAARYGSPDETPLDAHHFDPPHGAFFLAMSGEDPVGIAGWRFRAAVTAPGRRALPAGRHGAGPAHRRRDQADVRRPGRPWSRLGARTCRRSRVVRPGGG